MMNPYDDTERIKVIKSVINDIKNIFDINQLIAYVTQIDDKILNKIIIHSYQIKN